MSSVSPTGSDYSYYQQQVSDLEDQNAKDRKKADKRDAKNIADLESKYDKRLRESEEDAERAINRSKESSNSALSSEREDNKEEMNRLKRDTYDRYGRVARDNSAEYHKNLDELQNDLTRTHQRDDEALRTTRDHYGKELAKRSQRDESNTRRAMDDMREKYSQENAESRRNANLSYAGLADESHRNYDQLNRDRTKELATERRLAREALDDANQDYGRRLDLAKNAYEKNTQRQERTLRDSLTDHANRLRMAHQRETDHLREQMGDLLEGEKQYEKSGAQGRADAVGELENGWRRRFETQGSAYEQQIGDLKTQNNRTEDYLSHQNYENMRDRDAFTTRTIKAQNEKHRQEMQELESAALRDHDEMDALRKNDIKIQEKSNEQQMADAVANAQEALYNQAHAMRDSFQRQHQGDREQLDRATKALQEQRTSSDTALISPAAEAAIRKQIAGYYQKTANADQQRNSREADRLRGEYKQELMDVIEGDRLKDTKLAHQVTSERDEDNARFTTHVSDLESSNEATLRRKDEQSTRETEKLMQNFNRLMSHQNREHENQLDDVRQSADSKLDAVREDASFDRKMAIREFNDRESKLTHDYLKKLADQKTGYEDRLNDQKAALDSQAREKDRQFRNTLDQQSRAYEHRLAEQSAQFREHERMLTESFDDQLDKLKRSNQLLIQRRS